MDGTELGSLVGDFLEGVFDGVAPVENPWGQVFANSSKFRKVIHCVFFVLLRVADLEPKSEFGLRIVL